MPPVVFVLMWLLAVPPPAAQTPDAIAWVPTYDASLPLAREQGKLLVLYFGADWCPPCQVMDREVFPDPSLIAESRNHVFVKIDADRDGRSQRQYRIGVLPTFVLADPWETPAAWHQGYADAKTLLAMLRVMPDTFAPIAGAYDTLQTARDDHDALVAIARFYDRPQLRHLSYDFFNRAAKSPKARADRRAMDEAHLGMALARINGGQPKDGEKILRKRLKACDPSNEGYVLVALGTAYYHQKKIDDATKMFEQAAARFPGSEAARLAQHNLKKISEGQ